MEVKGTLKYRKVQRTPQTGENAGKKKWYATSVTDRSPRCITHRGLFFNPLTSRLPMYGVSPYMVCKLANSQYFANKYYKTI